MYYFKTKEKVKYCLENFGAGSFVFFYQHFSRWLAIPPRRDLRGWIREDIIFTKMKYTGT
jgi:hypothetical protein